MFSHKNIFVRRACALALVCPALVVPAFAAAGNARISTHNFADYYFVLIAAALGFGGSLFWWKRDKPEPKNGATAPTRRVPTDRHLRPTLSSEKKTLPQSEKPNAAEVDARFAAWVQSNVVNKSDADKNAAANNAHDAAAKSSAPQVIVLNFELPDQLPPLEPLPVSDAADLLDAIEQALDFDADETTREIAVMEMGEHRAANAVEALTQVALYDECARLRVNALDALGKFDHESTFETILLACIDIAREVRAAAARTLSRLSFDRATAYNRIAESCDAERIRLAAMACVDANLVNHAFTRLIHEDRKHRAEAFAMIRLLVAANNYEPIVKTVYSHADSSIRLATIQAVKTLKPKQIPRELADLIGNENLPAPVADALADLLDTVARA